MSIQQAAESPRRRSFVAGSVYVFEHIMPDPLVLAIGLTFLVALAAALFASNGFIPVILNLGIRGCSTSSASPSR